MFYFAEFCE
jgi:hypothetical protein